jgi:hypothetical protein
MWNIERVNARLDKLYARAYDLECIGHLDLDQDDHDTWKRTYASVTDEIIELEQRQHELLDPRECVA